MYTIYVEGLDDCPDIMHLVDNKFILLGTNGKYIIGTLSDNEFIIESQLCQFAYGETYSSQIWNNSPNNESIINFRLGNMENSAHISQMSIPIQLYYTSTLTVQPHQSIINNFTTNNSLSISLSNIFAEFKEISLNTCQFYLDMNLQNITGITVIELIDGTIKYDKKTFSYIRESDNDDIFCFDLCDKRINLQIVSDLNSIEIFINKEKYIGCFQYGSAYDSIKFSNVYIENLLLYEIHNF